MPQIKIDFSEVNAPTAKQIDFVQEICYVLGIAKPEEYTRDSYSDFISEHIDDYSYESNQRRNSYRSYSSPFREGRQQAIDELGMDASDFGMQAWGNS